MEGNKDEAKRCIELAKIALNTGNFEKAKKLLTKSKRLYQLPEAKELLKQAETGGPTAYIEGNKDEAIRCIELAKIALNTGNFEKAKKLLTKSQRLYLVPEAKELLKQLKSKESRNTTESASSTRTRTTYDESVKSSKATRNTKCPEHVIAIRRIQQCNNFYDMLGVSQKATAAEIDKSYKKLAKKLHPDKNTEPGALEAFKTLRIAVETLTDMQKRREYDEKLKTENQARSASANHADGTFSNNQSSATDSGSNQESSNARSTEKGAGGETWGSAFGHDGWDSNFRSTEKGAGEETWGSAFWHDGWDGNFSDDSWETVSTESDSSYSDDSATDSDTENSYSFSSSTEEDCTK